MAGPCGHINEASVSIRGEKFVDQLNDNQLLMGGSTLCS
jgi:hypothetical protein